MKNIATEDAVQELGQSDATPLRTKFPETAELADLDVAGAECECSFARRRIRRVKRSRDAMMDMMEIEVGAREQGDFGWRGVDTGRSRTLRLTILQKISPTRLRS
jgi:hypothetical protein